MALEDRGAQHDKEVVDKFVDPDGYYQMTTRDYVVRPSAINYSIVITLPPVADAKGRFYSIIARRASAFRTITISDKGDSECWMGNIVMNGKCDRALFYSDGIAWFPLMGGPGKWPGFLTSAAPGTTEPPTTLLPTSPGPTPLSTPVPTTGLG